jgi:hypothetical protein
VAPRGRPIAAAGAAMLAGTAWFAVDLARRSRPVPAPPTDAFLSLEPRISVAAEPGSGIDARSAAAVAVLLLGAALTVLAGAKLSRTEIGTPA